MQSTPQPSVLTIQSVLHECFVRRLGYRSLQTHASATQIPQSRGPDPFLDKHRFRAPPGVQGISNGSRLLTATAAAAGVYGTVVTGRGGVAPLVLKVADDSTLREDGIAYDWPQVWCATSAPPCVEAAAMTRMQERFPYACATYRAPVLYAAFVGRHHHTDTTDRQYVLAMSRAEARFRPMRPSHPVWRDLEKLVTHVRQTLEFISQCHTQCGVLIFDRHGNNQLVDPDSGETLLVDFGWSCVLGDGGCAWPGWSTDRNPYSEFWDEYRSSMSASMAKQLHRRLHDSVLPDLTAWGSELLANSSLGMI